MSINERVFGSAAGRLTPVAPPPHCEVAVEAAAGEPRLRIWACYPEGSHPESVEITYNDDTTAEFIAGIVQALMRPDRTTSIETTTPVVDLPTEALTRALDKSAQPKGHPA